MDEFEESYNEHDDFEAELEDSSSTEEESSDDENNGTSGNVARAARQAASPPPQQQPRPAQQHGKVRVPAPPEVGAHWIRGPRRRSNERELVNGGGADDDPLEQVLTKALKGRNKKDWCTLIEGVRFTNADSRDGDPYLPSCVWTEGGTKLIVPSMHVKDMKQIEEYTKQIMTPEGAAKARMVQMTARKFYTKPVDVSVLLEGWRATRVDGRYFLDINSGADAASVALAALINQDDDYIELVMPRALLEEEVVPFVRHLNKKGGYASCEIGRAGEDWFTVRNLQILGREEDGHAEFQSTEKSYLIDSEDEGNLYAVKEFKTARTVGTTNTNKMFQAYKAEMIREPFETRDYVPRQWPDGTFPDMPDQPKLKVPCVELTHTILPAGGMECSERSGTLVVLKPFHGVAFKTHLRHPGCVSIDKVDYGPLVADGFRTSLSALGASHLNADPPPYFRLDDDLQYLIWEKVAEMLEEEGDTITLRFVKAPMSHSAGNHGVFPIYTLTPVLRICDRWYNPYTLEIVMPEDELAFPKNLRYVDIAPKARKARQDREGKSTGSSEALSEPGSGGVPSVVSPIHRSDVSVLSDVTEPTLQTTTVLASEGIPVSPGSGMKFRQKASSSGVSQEVVQEVAEESSTSSPLVAPVSVAGTGSSASGDRTVVHRSTSIQADGTRVEKTTYSDGTTRIVKRASNTGGTVDTAASTSISVPSQQGHHRHEDVSQTTSTTSRRSTNISTSTQSGPTDRKIVSKTTTHLADGTCVEKINYSDGTTSTIKRSSAKTGISHSVIQSQPRQEKPPLSTSKKVTTTKRVIRTSQTSSATGSAQSRASATHTTTSSQAGSTPETHGGKRVKSRVIKTKQDGTRVEVIEYMDGSKVTKTYAASA